MGDVSGGGRVGLRFVIADDEHIPRNIMAQVLTNMGHDVVGIATNGKGALELIYAMRPDAVLLDVSMPGVQGSEVALICLREKLCRHVLMASSASQDAIRKPLTDAGAKFLAKPFSSKTLRQHIDKALAGG